MRGRGFFLRTSTESLYPKRNQPPQCPSSPTSMTTGPLLGRINLCWGAFDLCCELWGLHKRAESWRLRAALPRGEAVSQVRYCCSSPQGRAVRHLPFCGLPRLQGAVASGETTDLFFPIHLFIWLKKGRHFAGASCGHHSITATPVPPCCLRPGGFQYLNT